jgi:hypothetical protein
MTDFRALCAELADTLECVLDSPDPHCLALIARARAVLARWGVPAAVPTPEAKPTSSLKEQALLVLEDIPNIDSAHYNILQRALEQLND